MKVRSRRQNQRDCSSGSTRHDRGTGSGHGYNSGIGSGSRSRSSIGSKSRSGGSPGRFSTSTARYNGAQSRPQTLVAAAFQERGTDLERWSGSTSIQLLASLHNLAAEAAKFDAKEAFSRLGL